MDSELLLQVAMAFGRLKHRNVRETTKTIENAVLDKKSASSLSLQLLYFFEISR